MVDILAGASAGGLNGCLLAGSIIFDRPLTTTFLRDKWIAIGDFSSLLQPLSLEKPASIMQGGQFYTVVRAAFDELLGNDLPRETLDEVPVFLDVQVTNVVGEERCFYDSWDEPFYAREFRSPLRFREFRDYKQGTLAAAARASASFPGAFEPQKLYGDAARLGGFEGYSRYAVDGGLLENAPIKPALELISRRRSNGPVTRYVVYVDAAPTEHEAPVEDPSEPSLAKVLGYTFNLPRDARVVDQLLALDDYSRRAGITADVGIRLLTLDTAELDAIASTLLPVYQRRRAVLSLAELIGGANDGTGPRRAKDIIELLEADVGRTIPAPARLPWIPSDLTVPADAESWHWGVRAAQRVLQLEIDLLTGALAPLTSPKTANMILAARIEIERQLVFLDRVHADFASPTGGPAAEARQLDNESAGIREEALDNLSVNVDGVSVQVWESFKPAIEHFVEAYSALEENLLRRAGLPSARDLFGPIGSPLDVDAARDAFLGRALAVEVVRRTFSDDFEIETAELLKVAQLTPHLETQLFTLDGKQHDPGDAEDEQPKPPRLSGDKLAGLRFAHFGGFYRSSWRENDFMWGRMDGASAITRLLIDPERARKLHAIYHGSELEPARQLARALVPDPEDLNDGDRDRVALLRELVPESLPAEDAGENLEQDLREAIEQDLLSGGDEAGSLTRALCARAIQYQVLCEEVPHLLTQLDHDRMQGAHFTDLGWKRGRDSIPIMDILESIRKKGAGEDSIPARLGCDDPDEATSQLGLRTLSQTLLVGLSALTGVVPLSRFLQPVRVPVLAVRGAVAERFFDQLGVVLAFTGAAWYVVGSELDATPQDTVPLSLLWSAQFLALVVSLLAVVGVLAVPVIRAVRTNRWRRRLYEGGAAFGLLAVAWLAAFLWAWATHGFESALTAYQSDVAPSWLLWIVVAAGGFQVASSLNTVLKLTSPLRHAASSWVSPQAAILGGIGGVLAGFVAVEELAPAVNDWGWRTLISLLTFAAPVLLAFYLRLPWRAQEDVKSRIDGKRGSPAQPPPASPPEPAPASPPESAPAS